MKSIWKVLATALLASCMLASFSGCSDADEDSEASSSTTEAEETTEDETEDPDNITVDSVYELTYNPDKIPDDMAETIAEYFHAIYEQDYDAYQAQINPIYFEAMDAVLQEDYGYGMETEFEQYYEALVEYAGSEDFEITSISMGLAEEVLADEYDEDEDFVGEYLDTYGEFLGEDFVAELEDSATKIYDVAMVMTGVNGDGEEITIMENLEILIVETDGTYGILG